MDDLKINYTSGAKKELEILIDDIKKRIENYCVKDKYVAGDAKKIMNLLYTLEATSGAYDEEYTKEAQFAG